MCKEYDGHSEERFLFRHSEEANTDVRISSLAVRPRAMMWRLPEEPDGHSEEANADVRISSLAVRLRVL